MLGDRNPGEGRLAGGISTGHSHELQVSKFHSHLAERSGTERQPGSSDTHGGHAAMEPNKTTNGTAVPEVCN